MMARKAGMLNVLINLNKIAMRQFFATDNTIIFASGGKLLTVPVVFKAIREARVAIWAKIAKTECIGSYVSGEAAPLVLLTNIARYDVMLSS